MTPGARLALVLSASLAGVAACRSGSSSTAGAAASSSARGLSPVSSGAPPSGPTVPGKPPPVVELANAPGPAPSGSAMERAVRETAVLALLADATFARRLPVVDLEPGRAFDPTLRERVAPRIEVPGLRFGETKSEGPLPKEIVKRVLRQNFGRYRNCVAEALPDAPKLSGSIRLELSIETSGRVESVGSAGSNLKDRGVLNCVVDATRTLQFPDAPKGSRATQILDFAPPAARTPP